MISERKRKAAQFRAERDGKKAKILGQMEKELKSITSGAYKTSEEIRTKDSDFYCFLKTIPD